MARFSSLFATLSLPIVGLAGCASGDTLEPVGKGASLSALYAPAVISSPEGLEDARRYAEEIGSTSVVIIRSGSLAAEWGDTAARTSCHSVRKSLVSALFGIAVAKGMLDVETSIGDLGIDDKPPLDDVERGARVVDLLMSRSGIYHASVMDSSEERPARGTHPPNTFFYYNNWSFNVLGVILEQATGLSLGEAFLEWIALPIGMQDFRVEDVKYTEGSESIHPAWRFWISARDLARFGVLYLNKGEWAGRQIVPADWIEESITSHTDLGHVGYGYLWWVRKEGGTYFYATGTGGQKLIIDPARGIVAVNRVDTGSGLSRALWWTSGKRVNQSQFVDLIERVVRSVE